MISAAVILFLVVLVVAGTVVWRGQSTGDGNRSSGTGASDATLASVDSPSAEEQALIQAAERAPRGEAAPHRRLGEFYLSAGRPFEAMWAFASGDPGPDGDPATILGMAQALEAGLFHADAVALLEQLAAREPENGEAIRRLVELRLRMGRPREALTTLRHATAFVQTLDGAVLEGRVHEALGDGSRAEAAYRRAGGRAPAAPWRERQRATAVGTPAHSAGDGQASVSWHRLGLLALGAGRISDARGALQKAHDLDPSDAAILTDLGRAWGAGKTASEKERALGLFQEAVRSRPYAPAYYQAGLLLVAARRFPQAMTLFGRATTADRDFADAYQEAAALLERAGRRPEAHYQRGLYFSVRDLRVRSLREYLAMARVDPTRPDGLLLASQSHFKMQQNARALEVARRAATRFPKSADVREQLAALSILTTRRKEAGDLCRAWLREEPDAAQPLWMLGRIAVDSLRFDEGISLYDQALAKQPENPAFLQSLGEALLNAPGADRIPRAVEVLTRAVAVAPNDAKARAQLGAALMRAGGPEEARRQMLRSLDLDPNRGPTYSTVVQLARQLRRPGPVALFGPMVRTVEQRLREELTLWRRTWDRPDEPQGYLDLARFLIRTADLKRAESQLEEAVRLRPRWPEAEAELARARRLLAAVG